MLRLNFRIEMRKDTPDGFFVITSSKLKEVKIGERPAIFSFADISAVDTRAQPFDQPAVRSRHFICGLSFSLDPNFTGDEPMFSLLEKLGLPQNSLQVECRALISKWLKRRENIGSRRRITGATH